MRCLGSRALLDHQRYGAPRSPEILLGGRGTLAAEEAAHARHPSVAGEQGHPCRLSLGHPLQGGQKRAGACALNSTDLPS